MLVIQHFRHSSEQKLAIQGEVKEREQRFFMNKKKQKLSEDGRDECSGVAWNLSGTQYSGSGWEVHSTSQER